MQEEIFLMNQKILMIGHCYPVIQLMTDTQQVQQDMTGLQQQLYPDDLLTCVDRQSVMPP